MPQLDLYIWFFSVYFVLCFFFAFYILILDEMLVEIVSNLYLKHIYLDFLDFMERFILKYNYFISLGFHSNNYIYSFLKKKTYIIQYNQIVYLYFKSLKIFFQWYFISYLDVVEYNYMVFYDLNLLKIDILHKIHLLK